MDLKFEQRFKWKIENVKFINTQQHDYCQNECLVAAKANEIMLTEISNFETLSYEEMLFI